MWICGEIRKIDIEIPMNISIKRLLIKWGLTLIQVFSPTISNLFRKRQFYFAALGTTWTMSGLVEHELC